MNPIPEEKYPGDVAIEQKTSYDPNYFDPLAISEERHFWFKSRNQLIASFLKKLVRTNNISNFLEIGCGTGNVLRAISGVFPDQQIVGMDLFHNGLVHAKRRVSCSLVQGDLHAPPFSIQFGIIGLYDVLEHIEEDTRVLEDLYRMLEPEGYLMITVPAFSSLWSYFDVAGHHIRRYQLDDLNRKLVEAGFHVTLSSYFMGILFPLVWVRRIMTRGKMVIKSDDEVIFNATVEELKIVPVFNDIVYLILKFENWLICRGIHFPFGTSIIVLAEKSAPEPG